jgi:hypothetical protein
VYDFRSLESHSRINMVPNAKEERPEEQCTYEELRCHIKVVMWVSESRPERMQQVRNRQCHDGGKHSVPWGIQEAHPFVPWLGIS